MNTYFKKILASISENIILIKNCVNRVRTRKKFLGTDGYRLPVRKKSVISDVCVFSWKIVASLGQNGIWEQDLINSSFGFWDLIFPIFPKFA